MVPVTLLRAPLQRALFQSFRRPGLISAVDDRHLFEVKCALPKNNVYTRQKNLLAVSLRQVLVVLLNNLYAVKSLAGPARYSEQ